MGVLSNLQFDADIDKFAKAIGLGKQIVVRKIALDIYGKIKQRTPVDTGRAASAWTFTVGTPSDYIPPEEGFTAMPDTPLALSQVDGNQPIYIINNLPYIEPLEMGHSKQAPAGMVRLSLAEVASEIEFYTESLLPS